MKPVVASVTLAAVLVFASSASADPAIRATVDFEAPLAPYGQWVVVRGARVFRPAQGVVGRDFVPYGTRGHWVSTESGWVFQSDLPFAWATYHYGRWWYDDALGWVWYPDTTWGVSWVEWRYGGGYAGWAPLPPAVYVGAYRPRWVFVDAPRFCVSDPWVHRVPAARASVAFGATAPVAAVRHGNVVLAGPPVEAVARVGVVPRATIVAPPAPRAIAPAAPRVIAPAAPRVMAPAAPRAIAPAAPRAIAPAAPRPGAGGHPNVAPAPPRAGGGGGRGGGGGHRR